MQIAVLEKSETAWQPRILAADEQEEHFKAIEACEEYLGMYFTTTATNGPTPEVPKPDTGQGMKGQRRRIAADILSEQEK